MQVHDSISHQKLRTDISSELSELLTRTFASSYCFQVMGLLSYSLSDWA